MICERHASWTSAIAAILLAAPGLAGPLGVPIVTPLDQIPSGVTIVEALADSDGFGMAALDLGDVDGDGIDDLVLHQSSWFCE